MAGLGDMLSQLFGANKVGYQMPGSASPVLAGSPAVGGGFGDLLAAVAQHLSGAKTPITPLMIPTAANLSQFDAKRAEAMKQLISDNMVQRDIGGTQHTPEAMNAISYMQARYPNRMSEVTGGIYPDPSLGGNDIRAIANQKVSMNMLEPSTFGKKVGTISYDPASMAWPPQNEDTTRLINTFAHESQHLVDMSRWDSDKFNQANKGSYYTRETEVRARQAGDTGLAGYYKYKGLTK